MQTGDPFGSYAAPTVVSRRNRTASSPHDAGGTATDEVAVDQLLALRRIEALLVALPGSIAAAMQAPPSRLADADRSLLGTVLAAVAADVGPRGRVFSAREAVHYLADTKSDALTTISVGKDAVKSLGKLLARGDGQVIDGLLLMRDGQHRGSVNWRVSRV